MTYRKDLESAHLRIAALETTIREQAEPPQPPAPAVAPVAPAPPAAGVEWVDAWPVLPLVVSAMAFAFAHDFAVWQRLPDLMVKGILSSAVAGSALLTLELALRYRRGGAQGVASRVLWVLAVLVGSPAALVAVVFVVTFGMPVFTVVGMLVGAVSGARHLLSWVRNGPAPAAAEAPSESESESE